MMNTTKNLILVVDDDSAHRTVLKTLIGNWGYDTCEADDGSTAIDWVRKQPFDLILMDIKMLKVSGIEALEKIKKLNPAIPVVLMTAYASIETAIEAMKKGAYDYLTKPLDFDKLKLTIDRTMEHTRLRKENRLLKESIGKHFDRKNIIGKSNAMEKLLETVSQVAPTEATILITGGSGTGKELIAGALHFNSLRKNGPFVKINCAAITETLLESELFGHEKGAFTGADRRKEGRFKQADGGSLFLDEVSEMSQTMQVKLLRVLQEREMTPVGGEKVIKIDVRIITATNKNLPELIKQGDFREDLYYRLNVIGLNLPPLKERQDDIPLLLQHFIDIFSDKNKRQVKGFTPKAMDQLMRYDWPGNVRELTNAVERAVILSKSEFLDVDDFPLITAIDDDAGQKPPAGLIEVDNKPLYEVEKAAILRTLEITNGNKSETARRLGITRRTLHLKLKEYGIMS